jgi:hypothetical protein
MAQQLPDGLAETPAGPELAAALAQIDPAKLNGHDLVALAPVYMKLISHYQAGLATVLDQAARSPAGDADSPVQRTEQPSRWAPIEIAATLRWSTRKATNELRYADQLVHRLPTVHAALAAGAIDQPKARAFVDQLACLDQRPAQVVAERLLAAGAASWDLRTLVDKLRRRAIAEDPPAAARRYAQRLSERRVQARVHPDGTADLSALNLPPNRVAEITERITAIARTAKRQGDARTIDQLKADTVTDLLAGTGIGATPPAPVTNPGPAPLPATGRSEDEPAANVPLPGPRRGVVELTAPLSALIGLSQAPGNLAGFGPVVADIVRRIVAEDPDAQWRFSIYDDLDREGQLAYHGITSARPDSDTGRNGFSAADAAFLRARDRTCRGPQGCHTPACQLDHTIAKVDGGGHHRGNGGPLCTRDHIFKHQSGATLRQPQPGLFQWITPLGRTYTVKPEPYDEGTGPPEPVT